MSAPQSSLWDEGRQPGNGAFNRTDVVLYKGSGIKPEVRHRRSAMDAVRSARGISNCFSVFGLCLSEFYCGLAGTERYQSPVACALLEAPPLGGPVAVFGVEFFASPDKILR